MSEKGWLVAGGLVVLLAVYLFFWNIPASIQASPIIQITLTPQSIAPQSLPDNQIQLYQYPPLPTISSSNVKVTVTTKRAIVLPLTSRESILENPNVDNLKGAFVSHNAKITIMNATGFILYSKTINFTKGSEHTITITGDPQNVKEGTNLMVQVDVSITVKTPSGQTISRDKSIPFSIPVKTMETTQTG